MKIEQAQRVAELLQKIKVAKIQKGNFEKLNKNQFIKFEKSGESAVDNCVFSIGEAIESGNWILIEAIKHSAISYLEKFIEGLECELDAI